MKDLTNVSEMPTKKQLVRIETIAQFVGVTVLRIRQFTQEGIIKTEQSDAAKGNPGARYDFLPTIKALMAYYREKANTKLGKLNGADEIKIRRETAKAALDELKLGQASGHLHTSDEIWNVWAPMFERLRTNILSMPLGIAPAIANKSDHNEIAELLKERLERYLGELTDFDFDEWIDSKLNQYGKSALVDGGDENEQE